MTEASLPLGPTAPTKALPAATGPLAGLRVLDLTSVVMGPLATQIMGDLGADIICVEAAGGDAIRFFGPGTHSQLSGDSLNLLRNKRNIALNLKNPVGRTAFLRIAATCDIVLTNLRPAARARLGLDYEDVRQVKPDIIYCHAQGWASDSKRYDDPAFDDVIQAASGLAALFAEQNGKPLTSPLPVADQVSSLTIVYSLLAAVYHRQGTGQGQRVEIPMKDTMTAFVLATHGHDAIPQPPLGPPGFQRMLSPLRAPLPTKNGYFQPVLYSKDNWVDFFNAGGIVGAVDDPRLQTPLLRNKHFAELYATMADILKTRTTAEWVAFCKDCDIPNSPVVSLQDLVDELPVANHPVAGNYKQLPIAARFSASPAGVRRPAPLPGQHNSEILTEAGYSTGEIAQLMTDGGLITGEQRPK